MYEHVMGPDKPLVTLLVTDDLDDPDNILARLHWHHVPRVGDIMEIATDGDVPNVWSIKQVRWRTEYVLIYVGD
jgi:hypothetical protein